MTLAIGRKRTVDLAHGRWKEILLALGVSAKLLNGKGQPCPRCGGDDRFSYTDKWGDGNFFCRRCNGGASYSGNGIDLLCMVKGWDWRRALNEVDGVLGNPAIEHKNRDKALKPSKDKPADRETCRRIWLAGQRISSDDPAGKYFHRRGLTEADYVQLDKVLLYHPKLYHPWESKNFPGMIAVFSDNEGHGSSIQRTFLTEDGNKALIERPRAFLKGNLPHGGAIRLSARGEDLTCMGVAEGIETALSCRALRGGLPVWAATGAEILKQWQPPSEAREITIFADNDANNASQSAAFELQNRLILEARNGGIDRRVYVEIPPKILPVNDGEWKKTDWNDVLKQQQQEGN